MSLDCGKIAALCHPELARDLNDKDGVMAAEYRYGIAHEILRLRSG